MQNHIDPIQFYQTAKKGAVIALERLYKLVENSELKEDIWEKIEPEIEFLQEFTKLKPIQIIFFSIALFKGFRNSDFNDVLAHLGLADFKILYYEEEIDLLFESGYIHLSQRGRSNHFKSFSIDQPTLKFISNNIPLKKQDIKKENFVEIIQEFSNIKENYEDYEIGAEVVKRKLHLLLKNNDELSVVKKINSLNLNELELYLLFYHLDDALAEGSNENKFYFFSPLRKYCRHLDLNYKKINQIASGDSILVKEKILNLHKKDFKNDLQSSLTDEFVDYFNEQEGEIISKSVTTEEGSSELILPKNIIQKQLFYSESEVKDMERIREIIEPKAYQKLMNRLMKNGMSQGITVLFYGYPGTGKTESIFQLAKTSGRKLIQVDISTKKSMWFGESQKLVKEIFTNYKKIKENEKLAPILLFNEADALLSKRNTNLSGAVSQTENAIQNIFLQEMEDFEGIMMATTNLIENLDTAFERRFLFKVQFQKPTLENAAKIWRSKMKELSEKECLQLAEKYEFTGGQIENIARKFLIEKVVMNQEVNFKTVDEFCENERWNPQKSPQSSIGFKKAG